MTEQKAAEIVKRFVPEFSVKEKKDNLYFRLVSKLFPKFMTHFWTTIRYTAYRPDHPNPGWDSIFHEGIHALQAKKYTYPVFAFLYLFPQSLSFIFFPLSFLSLWFLIPAFLCLLPLPAPFRAKFEIEGYALSTAVALWKGSNRNLNSYKEYFAGPSYYYMFPFFDKWVMPRLRSRLAEIIIEPLRVDEYHATIKHEIIHDTERK